MLNRKFAIFSVAGFTLGLIGCDGGSSDAPLFDNPAAETLTVNGKVADGYLVGALACLDLNANKACDSNEPQATSVNGGVYSIELPDGVDANAYSMVVEVPANAIDEDTGVAVGGDYVLSAPAGKPEFVSPITTIIQTQMETNPGLSAADAESTVKDLLGYSTDASVDLFVDYVEAKADTSDSNAPEYERIHKIAQVTARALEANYSQVESAAVDAALNLDEVKEELARIIVKEVIKELAAISNAVDNAGEQFDADTVANEVDVTVDSTNIANAVTEEENLSAAVVTTMRSILEGGVNWVESDEQQRGDLPDVFYGRVGINAAGDAISDSEYRYDRQTASFVTDADENYIDITLSSSGWSMDADVGLSFSENADGSAMLSSPLEGQINVRGSSVDISGKPIGDFINEKQAAWDSAIPASAVFSAGSIGYRWTFTQVTDLYQLEHWGDEGDGLCYQDASGVAVLAADMGGNCNTVRGFRTDGPARNLAELVHPAGSTEFYSSANIGDNIGVQLVGDVTADSGTTRFVASDGSISQQGNWTKQIVAGVTMLVVPVPSAFTDQLWDDEHAKLIFAVHNGFVRRGGLVPAGQVDVEDEWNFNDSAMQDILTNVDLNQ